MSMGKQDPLTASLNGEPESYAVPESLDDDLLSQMDKDKREIKKVAKDLTDARQIRKRWWF